MAKSFDKLCRKAMSPASIRRSDAKARVLISQMLLKQLREASGLSQKALASKLGIRQPSLSKLEAQSDMQIRTLQKIIAALGGELDLIARLPNGDVRLTQFVQSARPARPASRRSAA